MLTLLLILAPIISALLLLISGNKYAKSLALSFAISDFVLAIAAWITTQNGGAAALSFNSEWIPAMGISFHLEMDGISLLMVLLSNLIMPIVVYASFNKTYNNAHILYALMFIMQSAMVGSFVAMDGLFIYTLFGSLFMLLALLYVYLHTDNRSFDIQALYAAGRALPLGEQGLIMGAFFLAFAIKMPVFPFHTWQPSTYVAAPTPGVMLLGGVMSKMATYGLIRWVLPMVPAGVFEYNYIIIGLSVLSIIYASCIAIIQKDFKYLIAYASIAHMGLIAAGIFAVNVQSLQGAMMEMMSHAINTVGLFFAYDIIYNRMHTSEMSKLGGIRGVESRFAFLFFIIVLSNVALPFTNGFVGEFLLILGVFQTNMIAASVAGLSIILGVVYMFRAYQKMMLGESNSHTAHFPKLERQEIITLSIIVLLIIGMGVFPKPILDITESSIQTLLQGIQ